MFAMTLLRFSRLVSATCFLAHVAIRLLAIVFMSCLFSLQPLYAQDSTADKTSATTSATTTATTTATTSATTSAATSADNATTGNSDLSEQLNVVQAVLDAKLAERQALREEITRASADRLPELEERLQELNKDIKNLSNTFEQIAVGSLDLGVFTEDTGEFNWRDEVTQVMMPIMQNLKALTEKPRKIEALKAEIALSNEQSTVIDAAVLALEEQIALANDINTRQTLYTLLESWSERKSETTRAVELANLKLKNLYKSDQNLWQSIKTGILEFIAGRGLTLLLAIVAATVVWYFMRFLSHVLISRAKSGAEKTYKTRQRLVNYAFKVLTVIVVLIAVIVVFYTRGDVLLMGLSILIVAGIFLGLRNTIPKFITESRLLLNLGSIREGERVIYLGLPYRVVALNMYSVLRNPELTGVIRLPLKSLDGMVSRPAGNEAWFPASKDDYIVVDGRVLQVTELTPELIQLENLSGTKTSMPSTEFYNMTFDNLTRGSAYSIVSSFGIGYKHQSISNTLIPDILEKAVSQTLAKSSNAQHVEGVIVELKEAGPSSLDYFVCVTMSNAAAKSYYTISRLIQQTCIETCTNENWEIPFPQLTLHRE